jgi:hypothetical protein
LLKGRLVNFHDVSNADRKADNYCLHGPAAVGWRVMLQGNENGVHTRIDLTTVLGLEVGKTKRDANQGVDLIAEHQDFGTVIQYKNCL